MMASGAFGFINLSAPSLPGETRRLGNVLALMTLDRSAMRGPKWAHRFIIAVNPVVEASPLLFMEPASPRSWNCRRSLIIRSDWPLSYQHDTFQCSVEA